MKMGESLKTDRTSHCLNCGEIMDGVFEVGEEINGRNPSPGDVAMCLYCGHLMAFGDDLKLREPNSAEIHDIAGDPRILAAMRARSAVKPKKP